MSNTPRTDREAEIAQKWLCNPNTLSADFARQLERELTEANARIKRLEEARTKAAANSLANMLTHEEARAKMAALIEAGDELAAVVWRDYRGAYCEKWTKAKGQP